MAKSKQDLINEKAYAAQLIRDQVKRIVGIETRYRYIDETLWIELQEIEARLNKIAEDLFAAPPPVEVTEDDNG